MAGEVRKTTARRGRATTRTKKVTPPLEPAIETPAPANAPPAVETPAVETPAVETPAVETPAVETPAPATAAPAMAASAPTQPATPPPPEPSPDWVPVIYEGQALFADTDAGVFVTGTRTRLRPRVAARLLRFEGFRLAA